MTGLQWGYGEDNGPSEWHIDFPIAQGSRQSPINIVTSDAVYDPDLLPLSICYDSCTTLSIFNDGHSVIVEFDDVDSKTELTPRFQFLWMHFFKALPCCRKYLSGLFKRQTSTRQPGVIQSGPLQVPYRLKQCHFHWGGKNTHGSEHTVNGKSYASELHLVHWNAVKYKTFAEAAVAPDGLAVIGIFIETGDDHPGLHQLTDAFYMVKFKGSKAVFPGFNPKSLLPKSLHYWTYPGSLTTPPLYENVIWIVLKEPIKISQKQMHRFRLLLFSNEDEDRLPMIDNFRPPQPLKGRKVRASFCE
ncbi:carbonic anhydrase 7 isoform X1 [Erpetoichthys calabaricus]|uniref:carbonic anhydrase 7 isoform X1 n=1 Tax=Erpetoichthys calabaricus TaxID=27687 RepID=UPI0010A0A7A7|nr:carbonic anhydrase 7 isoform X1 [Erpetoichthys calabaricus]